MKTINGKKSEKSLEDIKIFRDQDTLEVCGFEGTVDLYDAKIYVNTKTGYGYNEIIEKLKPLIYKLAKKYRFTGNTTEDTRHDIVVHILEGIPKYDATKNTKLSTFLEMRVNRRLINEIRNKSRISKNATYLNTGIYNVTCECGRNFVTILSKGDNKDTTCISCGATLDKAKKLPMNTPEINESFLCPSGLYDNQTSESSMVHENNGSADSDIIFLCDIKKWLLGEDPRVAEIIELYCFHDYSIKAAAEKVGLSGAGGNMKLKELSGNSHLMEILGR